MASVGRKSRICATESMAYLKLMETKSIHQNNFL